MSSWILRNYYGHGAAKIPIEGRAHRRPVHPDGLFRGLNRVLNESGDPRQAWLHFFGFVPLTLFSIFVIASLINRLASPPVDHSNVEMVMLDTIEFMEALPEPEVMTTAPLPEPEPVAVVPKPKPPPPVQRKAPPKPVERKIVKAPAKPRTRIKPTFAPPKLAIEEAPKPPPTRRAIRPEAQRRQALRPDLKMDQMARNETLKELPRAERMRKQAPRARKRPNVDLSPIASIEQTVPVEHETQTRRRIELARNEMRRRPDVNLSPLASLEQTPPVALPTQTRRRIEVSRNDARQRPDLAPIAQAPRVHDEAPPERRERFAVALPSRQNRNRLREAPMLPAGSPQTFVEHTPEPQRTRMMVAAPKTYASAANAPAFDVAMNANPTPSDNYAPTERAARATAPRTGSHTPRVDVRSLALADAGTHGGAQAHPAAISREDSTRVARVQQQAATHASQGGPNLQGVPLGSLASCRTDREEDSLKLDLVAAVRTQTECTSSAGTYRFIETKNLNAFLMWIKRVPGRPVGDRCVELVHALECLAQ